MHKPIHPATYYRGVKRGIYPAPVHPSPNVSSVDMDKLGAAIRAHVDGETHIRNPDRVGAGRGEGWGD